MIPLYLIATAGRDTGASLLEIVESMYHYASSTDEATCELQTTRLGGLRFLIP